MVSAHITVVEDESIVAMDLRHRLEQLGHVVVHVVSTGEDAVAALEDNGTELILMDIRLAGEIDGIEATRIIQETHDIPVLYLTAYADDETLQRAKVTESFAYLVKPVEDRELRSMIEIALYRHEKERALTEGSRLLEQRLRELHQLNRMFQSHLEVRFEAVQRYEKVLEGVRGLAQQAEGLVQDALSHPLPDLPMVPGGESDPE